MNSPLRIAVVGAGKMGRHHAIAIQRLAPRATLVAVADRDRPFAEALARELGVAGAYDDLATLMDEVRPDVVHIATAPASHAALARLALEKGAHIYGEKPFTERAEDARALLALARQRELRVCAGHQLLFEGPVRQAAPLLPHLGRIQHVESYFAFRQARRADGRTPLTVTEQLLDILPHPVYLLLHYLGADAEDRGLAIDGLRVDERGTVHGLIACGEATGVLVVTLHGRPVDSYVKVVGTRGTVTLDFVRGIVVPQLGAGSTIDKILDPYQRAATLAGGSTRSLVRRFARKERSYPGLAEAFGAFYDHIARDAAPPVTMTNIERTVALCDRVRHELLAAAAPDGAPASTPSVAVTGGTGLLGRRVVERLIAEGESPLVIARRLPPAADRVAGAGYLAADLGAPDGFELPAGITTVIHCAAETAGGWDAHQRNSIDATRNVLDAMRRAGATQLIHVSSLAVIDADARQPLDERSPVDRDGRRRGPYVWGKLESEKIAAAAEQSHGIQVRIVRPGPLVDAQAFDPPGKLGRAVGPLFVAMGSPRATIPVSDVDRVARVLAWMATHFDEAPALLNAIEPEPTRRRELVARVRSTRPGTRVVWFPTPLLAVASGMLVAVQKVVRPGRPAMSLRTAFESPRCDPARVRTLLETTTERDPALITR